MAALSNRLGTAQAIDKFQADTEEAESVQKLQEFVYEEVDEEPELHLRTYVALAAMFLLNLSQLIALQGPPSMLDYIGDSFNDSQTQTWIPNALALVQAVLGPVISAASDTFQVRKSLLVGSCIVSFIGSSIAPGAGNIYRVIVAQILIGFGFAAVPLSYCVPSEILPRRWRPMVQAAMNIAACIGALLGPVIIGSFTEYNRLNGWRNFYWVQMGFWGLTAVGLYIGYRPPKRHTDLDHLSFWQKLGHLDLPGSALLCVGLSLFLAGLCLGGGLFAWTNIRVLAPLVIGVVVLIAFGLYEIYGTKTGIIHHDLFTGPQTNGRIVAICTFLIAIEAIMGFSYMIFYPSLTTSLFTTDPMKLVARLEGYWVACAFGSIVFGYVSTRYRTVREPLGVGFLIFTSSMVGFATVQPDHSTGTIAFACMAGFGFGSALILIVSAVQLCTPHHLIATATAVLTSTRAVAATIFTAIYAAALRTQLNKKLAPYVAKAALGAGLPATSLTAFMGAFLANDNLALSKVSGVTPTVIARSLVAMKQAFADSYRVIYIIAAPFGVLAIIATFSLPSVRSTMNYGVDAPVERLYVKRHHGQTTQNA